MKLEISNRWKKGPKKFQSLENLARLLMARADPDWRSLSVALLDDAGMTALNREYFSRNRSTDVISFAYGRGIGEIFVNVERALRHRAPSRELALYLAHGCDHLSGATDDTPAQRARMLRRERRWLRDAGARADKLLRSM